MDKDAYIREAEKCILDFGTLIRLHRFADERTVEDLTNQANTEMKSILDKVKHENQPFTRASLVRTLFEQYCRALPLMDPETDDIDGISGYLRDSRVFNRPAEVARHGLRLDLTTEDIQNAGVSAVIAGLNNAGRTVDEMRLQTEHVLEISIVAHMVNHPTFAKEIKEEVGENYMNLAGNFDPWHTIAELAETLKESPNLVKNVPKWFNDEKGRFFKGGVTTLNLSLAQYLEERSHVQESWIKKHTEHENPYVAFVFKQLLKSRFNKGNWGQLVFTNWSETSDW